MDVNESLKYADKLKADYSFIEEYRIAFVADVAVALAAEVRRLQAPAVEAVPLGYALANLDGTIRNHGDGELMVYRNPFSRSDKTDCIPLYMHPPSLDGDTRKLVLELCNMFEQFGYMPSQGMELIGEIREKLGAGDENCKA